VIYGNTAEGAGRAEELDVTLQAFAEAVEVDGTKGEGQLAKQLGDLGRQEGWRLGLVRLTAGDLTSVVSAVCVVSEARPRRGRMFRMMALAVGGQGGGEGLATGSASGSTPASPPTAASSRLAPVPATQFPTFPSFLLQLFPSCCRF
jgi:hypothetical protein